MAKSRLYATGVKECNKTSKREHFEREKALA